MSEWISVKERLPEQSGEILCYADGQIFNAYYDDAIDDDFQIGRWNQYFNPDTFYLPNDEHLLCKLTMRAPCNWNTSDPPRFTQVEAERAKMLYSVGILEVKRMAHGSDIFAYAAQNRVGHSAVQRAWNLPGEFFPSIQPGEIVKQEDIINEKA